MLKIWPATDFPWTYSNTDLRILLKDSILVYKLLLYYYIYIIIIIYFNKAIKIY